MYTIAGSRSLVHKHAYHIMYNNWPYAHGMGCSSRVEKHSFWRIIPVFVLSKSGLHTCIHTRTYMINVRMYRVCKYFKKTLAVLVVRVYASHRPHTYMHAYTLWLSNRQTFDHRSTSHNIVIARPSKTGGASSLYSCA